MRENGPKIGLNNKKYPHWECEREFHLSHETQEIDSWRFATTWYQNLQTRSLNYDKVCPYNNCSGERVFVILSIDWNLFEGVQNHEIFCNFKFKQSRPRLKLLLLCCNSGSMRPSCNLTGSSKSTANINHFSKTL